MELVRIYRVADTAAKDDPEVLEECRRELVKLQQGEAENRRIWQRCVDLSIAEFSKIYDLLGVHFDYQLGESFYNPELPRVVRELQERGLAEVSDGAVVVWDHALSKDPFIILQIRRRIWIRRNRHSDDGVSAPLLASRGHLVRRRRASAASFSATFQSCTPVGIRG